jgi:hypothetical protein
MKFCHSEFISKQILKMKSIIIFSVFFLLFQLGYSHGNNCDIDGNKLKVYKYILNHYDTLSLCENIKVIKVEIDFSKKDICVIESVKYLRYDEFEIDKNSISKEIKICPNLNSFIKNTFLKCCENSDLNNRIYSIEFFFTLDREELPEAIKELNRNISNLKNK